jgi:cell division protein FtsB
MKKNYILIVIFLILILVYGLFYVANLRIEDKISNLKSEFNAVKLDNEVLNNSLLYYESPAHVESIAKSKYKMIVPRDFYIIGIKNEE